MMSNRPDEARSEKKPPLLPVDQALAAILALLPQTNTITKPLDEALGFTLADDLVAVLTLPPQAVSAMDGYAVRAADVTSFPCKLTRIAESAAGHPWTGKIGAGQAVRVFTGAAMLPDLPKDRIAIAESGLFTPADLARMAAAGARCFLIGESLMRADDVAAATKTILANPVAG